MAFCAFAWAGAPEDAKAPASMITSFCMSWIMSAVRAGWIPRALARAGAAAAPATLLRLRMKGSLRGPTPTSTA